MSLKIGKDEQKLLGKVLRLSIERLPRVALKWTVVGQRKRGTMTPWLKYSDDGTEGDESVLG